MGAEVFRCLRLKFPVAFHKAPDEPGVELPAFAVEDHFIGRIRAVCLLVDPLVGEGVNYTLLCQTFRELPDAAQTGQSFVLYGEVVNGKGRYVHYKAIRSGNPRQDWLFTDEILIN